MYSTIPTAQITGLAWISGVSQLKAGVHTQYRLKSSIKTEHHADDIAKKTYEGKYSAANDCKLETFHSPLAGQGWYLMANIGEEAVTSHHAASPLHWFRRNLD